MKKLGLFLLSCCLLSCLPKSENTSCSASETYDASNRRCMPKISSSTGAVFIRNPIPLNSYTISTIQSAVGHTISVTDTYDQSYTTKWTLSYVKGSTSVTGVLVASNTGSYSFDPGGHYGAGNYVLQVAIYDVSEVVLYDSKTWNITVEAPANPLLVNPSPATSAFSYPENLSSATHSLELSNSDNISGSYRFLVDSVVTSSGTFSGSSFTFSENISPLALGTGIHTVELELFDTAAPATIFDSYIWTVNILNPDNPRINLASSTPSYYQSISVISGEAFSTGAGSGYRDGSNNAINEVCIVVDDADKNDDGSSDVDVIFEINGNIQGAAGSFNQASPTPNVYCHTSFDTLSLTNADISESRTLNVKLVETGTTNVLEVAQWNMNVRPRNMRPLISIDATNSSNDLGCTANSNVAYTGCTMTQSLDVGADGSYAESNDIDNRKFFAIQFQAGADPDIQAESDYEVYYEIKSASSSFESLDGLGSISRADCEFAPGDTSSGLGHSKLSCPLSMDAFASSGNVPPGTYTLQAFVRDTGSTWDSAPKESNIVTWQLTVTEVQAANSISVAAQASTHPAPANESWLENSGSDCSSTGIRVDGSNSINEGDYITIHTLVRDFERDNFNISIKVSNAIIGGYTSLVGLSTYTKTDDSEYTEVTHCVPVPQSAVSGASSGAAEFVITVSDIPDTLPSQAPSSPTSFLALVNNYNPAPVITDNSSVDLSTKKVFAGRPFSIAAPAYSDASVVDGNKVTWQWQMSLDNGVSWIDIAGADSLEQTSANLIWTPALDIAVATVDLRLCLGDDGFGNSPDCSQASATKTYEDLQVFGGLNNLYAGSALDDINATNLAAWYDETNSHLYTAYTVGVEVFVNKQMTNANGKLESVHTISFPSEAPSVSLTSNTIGDLSITGTDGDVVLVAYTSKDDATGQFRLKLRRLDISREDLAFSYDGLFVDASDTDDRVSIAASDLSFSSLGDGDFQISVSSVNNGDQFTISTSSGSESFVVGNGASELCPVVTCSASALAANIASAINNHINPEISHEMTAENTTGSNVVNIYGAGKDDFINEAAEVTPIIGNVQISPVTGQWVIPYVDVNNDLRISLITGNQANANLSTTIYSTRNIATSTFMKKVQGQFQADGDYVLVGLNDNNNLSLYRLDSTYNLQAPAIEDPFTLGSYIVEDFDFKLGASDDIYVGVISSIAPTSYQLGALFATSDLVSETAVTTLNQSTSLSEDVNKVAISPSPTDRTRAAIAVGTTSSNSSALDVLIGDLSHSFVDFNNPVKLLTTASTSYVSPSVNTGAIHTTSALTFTAAASVTAGHVSASSGVEDSTKASAILSFIQVSGSNNQVMSAQINIEREDIMSTSSSAGEYQAPFIKN